MTTEVVTMRKLYSMSWYKIFNDLVRKDRDIPFYKDAYYFHSCRVQEKYMDVMFCKGEKGAYVVAGELRRRPPFRSGKYWHGGSFVFDVYYRRNFNTRDEGNAFYRQFQESKRIA